MICGSCGMRMDGAAVLACKTRMQPIVAAGHVPAISAMGNLPIVKDLVVDMGPFWSKIRAMKPWLQPGYDEAREKERIVSQQQMNVINKEALCIMCGCCVSECNSMEADPEFLGPAALAKGFRFVGDPRDARDRRAARGLQLRARHLGLHALLLLQRALPEGRRSARCDRQARRRVDQGRDRPRHGREAREVVRHLREDDRLAARDRARAEDAGHHRGDQADRVRARARQARQGAASRAAARREGRRRRRARSTTSSSRRASTARSGIVQGEHALGRIEFEHGEQRSASWRRPPSEGRVLQGLPRFAVREGARHLDAGARADARPRAGRARVGHVLRRRRHPRGRARLLPAPERAHPRVRRGDRRRDADDDLQRLHAQPAAGELAAQGRRGAARARQPEPRGRRRAAVLRQRRGEAPPLADRRRRGLRAAEAGRAQGAEGAEGGAVLRLPDPASVEDHGLRGSRPSVVARGDHRGLRRRGDRLSRRRSSAAASRSSRRARRPRSAS